MRTKLSEKYQKERDEICDKMIAIIGLSEDNTFLLCDLDNDLEKQTAILNMKDEIQKCFASSELSILKPHFICKRPYLNIIRGILRKQGYTFTGNDYWEKYDNGLLKRTIIYKVFRK